MYYTGYSFHFLQKKKFNYEVQVFKWNLFEDWNISSSEMIDLLIFESNKITERLKFLNTDRYLNWISPLSSSSTSTTNRYCWRYRCAHRPTSVWRINYIYVATTTTSVSLFSLILNNESYFTCNIFGDAINQCWYYNVVIKWNTNTWDEEIYQT